MLKPNFFCHINHPRSEGRGNYYFFLMRQWLFFLAIQCEIPHQCKSPSEFTFTP